MALSPALPPSLPGDSSLRGSAPYPSSWMAKATRTDRAAPHPWGFAGLQEPDGALGSARGDGGAKSRGTPASSSSCAGTRGHCRDQLPIWSSMGPAPEPRCPARPSAASPIRSALAPAMLGRAQVVLAPTAPPGGSGHPRAPPRGTRGQRAAPPLWPSSGGLCPTEPL